MLAMLLGNPGEPAALLPDMTIFKRQRSAPQLGRPRPRMDEAMKAGIGAALCSVIILVIMFMVLHALPVSIG